MGISPRKYGLSFRQPLTLERLPITRGHLSITHGRRPITSGPLPIAHGRLPITCGRLLLLAGLLPFLFLGQKECPTQEPVFSAYVEAEDGSTGTVLLELTPAWEGGTIQRFEARTGTQVDLYDLEEGPYGLMAWLDEDGDGEWDGIWAGAGEPTARMGITLPRTDFRLELRRGPPRPILDANSEWVALNEAAWGLAIDHIAAGTPQNGFSDHYMDEAFSDQIFQWDTCFMTLFGRYATDAFPVMGSLDNFYEIQDADGYICRVANESDGQAGGDASDPSEPMINPPLFGWAELLYARQTADLSRLPHVIKVLDDYHDWLDANVRTGLGLYYTSMLGSGMDNAPRDEAYQGWIDITAQQALGRRVLAELAEMLGDQSKALEWQGDADQICNDIRTRMWNEDEGFFFDIDYYGNLLTDKTLASIWPLLAACATDGQTSRVIAHLEDPAEFWRVHVFPSTAADSPYYDPDGYYWRGGVWAPTNYATIVALRDAGRRDLARKAARNDLEALSRVYSSFVPSAGQLASDANGDGTETLWELYAPDAFAPGTRWDNTYLGRQDFVGWTGLGPIALLLEDIIGLDADALSDTLTWHLTRTDHHGVEGFRFGDQLVDLSAAERANPDDPVTIEVDTTDPFVLVVEMAGRTWRFGLRTGYNRVTVDPGESQLAVETVPAGPFPGYAVLGNGQLSVIWSDDDGSGTPPGIAHLYRGNFGLDLAEAGRNQVVVDGQLVSGARVGTDPFFAAYSELSLPCGTLVWRAFVGQPEALFVHGALVGGETDCQARVVPHLELRTSPHIDGNVALGSVGVDDNRKALWAEYSDGTGLALGTQPAPGGWQWGDISDGQVTSGLTNQGQFGRELALEIDLAVSAGETQPFFWAVALGNGASTALTTLDAALAKSDPLADAALFWDAWAPENLCATPGFCQVAAANLYAARASSLGGMVPADLTGQFVTNGYPQLYPRDALMVARAFTLTGHVDDAWEIVHDWLGSGREGPSPGEWYARYDALGRAVDGGSGAAYDVPEWDSNGYVAALVERLGPEKLSSSERTALLQALDFLVNEQDEDGLFLEGGIVEWVGRLPGTAMTNWVGLDAGARIADRWGENVRAAVYRAAAGRIRGGLLHLFDMDRMVLADERDGTLSYDTSMLFGPAWGYPAEPLLDASLEWILREATAHGGGVRYFEGMGYGQDLFFFTTSAASEYAATIGDLETASDLYQWMTSFSNRYGLAPERVYSSGSGAADASPLSWCAAEVAVALLTLEADEAIAGLPSVDGNVVAAEYRRWGPSAVDSDGAPDDSSSPVALYAARDGKDLVLGLRLAGRTSALASDATYSFYFSGADGTGAARTSEGGQPFTFRADPSTQPGAVARARITPSTNACAAGPATGDGYADQACSASAVGPYGLELKLDLEALGCSGPVQIIAAADTASGEALLPAYGALLTDGDEGKVLVTFEVDARSVSRQLNPAAGVVVTLSGDRPELGAWAGHALGLVDDGTHGDRIAGDNLWTTVVEMSRGGYVEYKYLVGVVGDSSWSGVEFYGDNRFLWVQDANQSGRVKTTDTYGTPGGTVSDP